MCTPFARFCNCDSDCHCGEDNVHEWTWDEENASRNVTLANANLEVQFNTGYSTGTAAVRGKTCLEYGNHYYWEVKMLTRIYGTDVMVGLGSTKVDLNSNTNTFVSLLGMDQESFGFSYNGYIQYNGEARNYSVGFGKGSLVGVHFDTWRGTIQFFLNRNPLGIAFVNVKDGNLYPIVCSTAANSRMRLTCCRSMPVSLQSECLAVLQPKQREYLCATFPGLKHLSKNIFTDVLRKQSDHSALDEPDEDAYPPECIITDEYDFILAGLSKKRKRRCSKT